MIKFPEVYRQSVVTKHPDTIPYLGFEEIVDDLGIATFGRHTALGDVTTVRKAYVKLRCGR